MKHEEITKLIWFSSYKLPLFFENVVHVDDNLANFGVIMNGRDQ